MKVVLFCGGFGMRIREYSDSVPKPMVPIGYRPILWHVMKYYAYFGHKEFILCLGYRGDTVKDYFRNYDETLTNDFVVTSGNNVELLGRDTQDWKITLVDTGVKANVGRRLLAVRDYLGDDEMFLANYSDGLTDAPLDKVIERFRRSGHVASFLSVRPTFSYHFVSQDGEDLVSAITDAADTDMRINGGFFILRKEVFDYIKPGEDLVPGPFRRIMAEGKLMAYRHEGFWASMDTFKDRLMLEQRYEEGDAPWQVWNGTR